MTRRMTAGQKMRKRMRRGRGRTTGPVQMTKVALVQLLGRARLLVAPPGAPPGAGQQAGERVGEAMPCNAL
jgi:hypothetical protein